MKKIIILLFTLVLLSSCSLHDLFRSFDRQNPKGFKSLVEVHKVKDAKSRSFIAPDNKNSVQAKMLNETIAVDAQGVSLRELLEQILPKWTIHMPDLLDDVTVDAVIQTTRKQAVFDILAQLRIRSNFYTQTKPQPTLVIYEN